jgi:hypothetical protein
MRVTPATDSYMYNQLFSLLTIAALTTGVMDSPLPGASFLQQVFVYTIKGFDFTFTQQFQAVQREQEIKKIPAFNSKSGKEMRPLPDCSDPNAACAIRREPTIIPTGLPVQPTLPVPTVSIEPTITYIPLPEPTIWITPCDRKWPVDDVVEAKREKLTIVEIPPCIHLDEY